MALTLADLGADQILKGYFINSWPASRDWKLRLFSNDFTPGQGTVLGDYTQVTGGGYVVKDVTCGSSWVVTPANDPSDAIYSEITWTFTGTIGGSGIVYGYYLEDNNGSTGVAIYGERLATPFTPQNNGDTLKITLKFQLGAGTFL